MRRESPDLDSGRDENRDSAADHEKDRRKEALHVLLEARERLLSQMAEDILSNREVLLDSSGEESFSSFELEEIENRYSARLNALNSLLENLEYRHPHVRHRVETLTTTLRALKRDLGDLLTKFDEWDLVNLEITPISGEELLVVAALTADEYPE